MAALCQLALATSRAGGYAVAMKKALLITLCLSLAACSQKDNGVRVAVDKPAVKATPKAVSRSEPVFYNGKTYRVDLTPGQNGIYNVAVNGMSDAQQNDAVAVATSSVRYFGCPDGKTGKLNDTPLFDGKSWKMSTRCG
jgi:hypothetical protein